MSGTARAAVVAELVETIAAVCRPHPVRVAIDGPDAAGKTTLADELAAGLRGRGREAIRASIDGFHRPRAARYRRGPDSPEGYYEDSFDYAAPRGAARPARPPRQPEVPEGRLRLPHGRERPRGAGGRGGRRRPALRRRLPTPARARGGLGSAHLRGRPARGEPPARPRPRSRPLRLARRGRAPLPHAVPARPAALRRPGKTGRAGGRRRRERRSGEAVAQASLEEPELDGRLGHERRERLRGLRRRGCDLAAEQLRQAREVGLEHPQHRRRVERRRRVVQRVEQHATAPERRLLLLAVDSRDAGRLAREQLSREVAECRDDARLDELDLAEEVALARLDLVGLRVAVAGRAALDDVRDVDLAAFEADPGEQPLEELPGLADERHALLVLVEPRRLADEHEVGVRRA